MSDPFTKLWYVVHTKSRFENVVNDSLIKKSFEAFLPKVSVPSTRRDRKKIIRVPLFPGYVFVKTDLLPTSQLEVVKVNGIVRFIGDTSGPISVQNKIVESLQIVVSAGQMIETGFYQFKQGDTVLVRNGAFTGVIGIFERYKGKSRVVVNIEAIGRYVSVEVDEDDIELKPNFNI